MDTQLPEGTKGEEKVMSAPWGYDDKRGWWAVLEGSGQKVDHTHAPDHCAGEACPIHRPSDHNLRDRDQVFSSGVMYRVVANNTFEVDPDDPSYEYWKHTPLLGRVGPKNIAQHLLSLPYRNPYRHP